MIPRTSPDVHYSPLTAETTLWGIGHFNVDGRLITVTARREAVADATRPLHTEETARADREAWVGPGGAWHDNPDAIRVVSQTINPWTEF